MLQKCPICMENIPVNELNEHMRIELLDPNWRKKKKPVFKNTYGSNLVTSTSICNNLNALAKKRNDVFVNNDKVVEVKKIKKRKITKIIHHTIDSESQRIPKKLHKSSMSLENKQNYVTLNKKNYLDSRIAEMKKSKIQNYSINAGEYLAMQERYKKEIKNKYSRNGEDNLIQEHNTPLYIFKKDSLTKENKDNENKSTKHGNIVLYSKLSNASQPLKYQKKHFLTQFSSNYIMPIPKGALKNTYIQNNNQYIACNNQLTSTHNELLNKQNHVSIKKKYSFQSFKSQPITKVNSSNIVLRPQLFQFPVLSTSNFSMPANS